MSHNYLRTIIAAFCALASLGAAQAQITTTWTGATDNTWAGANWSPSNPGAIDTALFNASSATVNSNTTIDLGAGITVGNLTFDTANAAAYTIGNGAVGSQSFTLNDAGVVTMTSTVRNSELINAAVTLGTDATALEALLSGRLEGTAEDGRQYRVKLGVGAGLNPHFGEPEWRFVIGIELFDHSTDRDKDTVFDSRDACPDVPGVRTKDPRTNGCPKPPDGDGAPAGNAAPGATEPAKPE